MTGNDVLATLDRFAAAEHTADTEALDGLLSDDFQGIGPLGFVLTKEQWLDRYASGSLVPTAFDLVDVSVRRYGGTAVATAVQKQEMTYHGHPANGEFRAVVVLSEQDGRWVLVNCQVSGPLGPPPNRPPDFSAARNHATP